MITLKETAFAKLNLTLDVLSKRADGYHELQSIMQAVDLCDDIEIDLDTGLPWELHCSKEGIPCNEKNLAWKAAKLFFAESGKAENGIRIRIQKRIPSEAGMGGGSADAAAVLRALNRHFGSPYSAEELADLSAKLGSDIPFCVRNGTAFAEGRGERLRPLSCRASLHYLICKPELSFSTPKLFAKLDDAEITLRPDQQAMEQALLSGNDVAVGKLLCNVFEQAVLPDFPQISMIKEVLLNCGALGAQMTGSGSVVFGIFESEKAVRSAATAPELENCQLFVCKNV